MALTQTVFDALNGVGVDTQTAFALQTLLSTQPGTPVTLAAANNATIDEEDLFQCGKCKDQFTSFSEFFAHKKTHNAVRLETIPAKDETNGLMYSEIVTGGEPEFAQPITLSDSDILSLSMDNGPLNIASQVLDGCAYLTTTDQEQAFQIPMTINSDEVTITTVGPKRAKKEINDNDIVTVSVLGHSVHEQIAEEIRVIERKENGQQGKMRCMYCGKSFMKNFDLQQHLRSHTGERPFQCVVCGRTFAQKSNVRKHMATHKVWPKRIRTLSTEPIIPAAKNRISEDGTIVQATTEDGDSSEVSAAETENIIDKSYVCQYCPAIFKNYFELKTHRKVHIHQKVYRCIQKNCSQTFNDLDGFIAHTQIHENDAQYHCHVCNKEFRSLDELGAHQYSHSLPTVKPTPRVVYCKKCKSKFANLEGLERHMVSDNHTYPCPQCSKVFTGERFLRRHLVTHSSTLSYVCPSCNKAFKTEQYLKTHIVIHSKEKPYACQHCQATFNRRDKLVRHNLIHENVSKFKCPFSKHLGCTKTFNRKDKLKAHMLTHSAKIKYVCDTCDRVFQKQAHLKQHEKACPQKLFAAAPFNQQLVDRANHFLNGAGSNAPKRKKPLENGNMSTIEIVVVPVACQKQDGNNKIGQLNALFPAASKSTNDLVDLPQNLTPDQEVPIFKSTVIPTGS